MSQARGGLVRADVQRAVPVTRRGKRTTRARQIESARAEAVARGYQVESVTWSDDLKAPVVQVWAGVQSVTREEPS